MGESVKLKDTVYYARIIPTVGIFDVCQLVIRTVENNYFLLHFNDLNKTVFTNRKQALDVVLTAEKNNKNKIYKEILYEEY